MSINDTVCESATKLKKKNVFNEWQIKNSPTTTTTETRYSFVIRSKGDYRTGLTTGT